MPSDSGDRGASPERTRLSWRRTSLVATVVAILLGRMAAQEGKGIGVAALAALCWVALLVLIQRRVHTLARPVPLRSTAPLVLTALACLGFATLGVILVLA